ncbi:MAG: signal transduction histidine kinase regulating citrate/malate metabolism, partial [Friedmanniella sp.]|nr:signal transduction histidine kinase regulating citrate/malate metabolism [Friedmanniella sp.]
NLPGLVLAAAAVLAVGFLGALLITRRLRRQTHGLGEQELGRMYEYYDAVLHSVREGLVLLDREHRVQLVNAEGQRLLGLRPDAVGRPVTELGLPPTLADALAQDEPMVDEIHLVDARMLVVNRRTADRGGRDLGSVVTFRDHTEIQAMAGELDTVRGMADSLRSQNHEAANRLHTVVSLIEIGRTQDAVAFATRELEVAQRLTDRVVASVEHPVVAALLLGKTAQAAERGVLLELAGGSALEEMGVEASDAVTILGNLVDNAIDATGDGSPDKTVQLSLQIDADRFLVRVEDSGPGIRPGEQDLVFRRGWSTKASPDGLGRGIGLALVVQTVRRYGGDITVATSALGGASFTVTIDTRDRAGRVRA